MMSRQRTATRMTTRVAAKATISTTIAPTSTLVEGCGGASGLAVMMIGA
jgi:hypothetical protein